MPDIDVNLANPPLASGPYVRLGAGSDWPKANGFSDNNCARQQAPQSLSEEPRRPYKPMGCS